MPQASAVIAWLCCVGAALHAQSSPRDLHARAVALEAEGNHAAALSLLWEAAGLAPRDADVQNRLGEALERIGALDAAIDAYRRALAARPDFRKAANNLILTLVKAGRGPEAVRARPRARGRRARRSGSRSSRWVSRSPSRTSREAIDDLPPRAGARAAAHARALQPGARAQARRPAGRGDRRARAGARDRAARPRSTTRSGSSTGTRATWTARRAPLRAAVAAQPRTMPTRTTRSAPC